MVFVLDKHQKPLMPCTEKRARLLLERGRAVIHTRAPFTIRLKATPKSWRTLKSRGWSTSKAHSWAMRCGSTC